MLHRYIKCVTYAPNGVNYNCFVIKYNKLNGKMAIGGIHGNRSGY